MSEHNKNVARRVIDEVWNRGDFTSLDETHAPHYQYHGHHDPHDQGHAPGVDSIKKMVELYRGAFPDLRVTIDEVVAEHDAVVVRYSSLATHKGELGGIDATHKEVRMTGVFWWRFEKGQIVEGRSYWDSYGLLKQIGVVPDLSKAS